MVLLSSLFAQIGTLIQKDGLVKVKHQNSIKKVSLKVNDTIENGDTIYTYKSIAVIKLNDESIIKLTPYSQIEFNKNKLSQKQGEIYFNIKKRETNKIVVSTAFTTIGVKGTTFIVNDKQKNCIVALKKGALNFKSLSGKYELHKKKLMNEFDDFVKKQEGEFKDYKKKLYKEFIEYTAEFELKENKTVSFNGNKVYENDMNKNDSKSFDNFEVEFKLTNFDLTDSKHKEENIQNETNSSTVVTKTPKPIETKKVEIEDEFEIKVRNPKEKNIENNLNINKIEKPTEDNSFDELDEE
jgi:hypothetical protein